MHRVSNQSGKAVSLIVEVLCFSALRIAPARTARAPAKLAVMYGSRAPLLSSAGKSLPRKQCTRTSYLPRGTEEERVRTEEGMPCGTNR